MKSISLLFATLLTSQGVLATTISTQILTPGTSVLIETRGSGLVSYVCPGTAGASESRSWYCVYTAQKFGPRGDVIGEMTFTGTSTSSKAQAFENLKQSCISESASQRLANNGFCASIAPNDSDLECKTM